KFGSNRIPAQIQPRHSHRISRRADHRRGIYRLAASDAATLFGRAGLLLQVEHGLDARHPALLQTRADPSQVSSERSDLRDALPLSREFHPAALARRSGAWQRLAPEPHAW